MANIRAFFRKLLALGLAILLSASSTAVASAAALAPMGIGAAAAVRGGVLAFSSEPESIGRIVSSGMPLYLNEKIKTDAGGRLQIMLKDETVFTIGPSTEMTIDEFVYDPNTDSGKVVAKVTEGFFRFVTGKIGHKNPSAMSIKLPTGTLGIRGTIISALVEPSGAATVMLGNGAMTVSNLRGDNVDVKVTGFATRLPSFNQLSKAPSSPALLSVAELRVMAEAFAPAPEQKTQDLKAAPARVSAYKNTLAGRENTKASASKSAEAKAGKEPNAAGPARVSYNKDTLARSKITDASVPKSAAVGITTERVIEVSDKEMAAKEYYIKEPISAVQAIESVLEQVLHTTQKIQVEEVGVFGEGLASWDDARAVAGGTGMYTSGFDFNLTNCEGKACSLTGSGKFALAVDFGARSFSLKSYLGLIEDKVLLPSGGVSGSMYISGQDYSALTGPAAAFATDGQYSIKVTLNNVLGVPAATADAVASYKDKLGTVGSGAVAGVPNSASLIAEATQLAMKIEEPIAMKTEEIAYTYTKSEEIAYMKIEEPIAVIAEPTAVIAEPTAVIAEPTAVIAEPTAVIAEPIGVPKPAPDK